MRDHRKCGTLLYQGHLFLSRWIKDILHDSTVWCLQATTVLVSALIPSQFLMPGLVDTHIHAPQYVNSGTGYDLMLLDWLKKYTFPTEARFQDLAYAKDVYTKAVVRKFLVHVLSIISCILGSTTLSIV